MKKLLILAVLVAVVYLVWSNRPSELTDYKLSYRVEKAGDVTIKIYDKDREIVNNIKIGQQLPGFYEVSWDARNSMQQRVEPGSYEFVVFVNAQRTSFSDYIEVLKPLRENE
jgi:flagellar hook assembly protein FlgD